MATLTPGFSGADIANIVNEAALRAARKNKNAVDISDFYEANDRVIGGLEKRISSMTLKEKEMIAHHEAGHAVAGWFLENAEPLLKVTVCLAIISLSPSPSPSLSECRGLYRVPFLCGRSFRERVEPLVLPNICRRSCSCIMQLNSMI